MRILVIGGAGFIGGHLAESFLREGYDVTTLDAMDPFYDLRIKEHTLEVHRELAVDTDCEYHFVDDDIWGANLLAELVPDFDAIYH